MQLGHARRARRLRRIQIAADANNKGREMDLILISKWCPARGTPAAEALAALDLFGDQGGRNLAKTLARAASRYGLYLASLTQTLTDGA
eukprot:5219534-Pleurochrysis_carterae.AAC.2